jgi:hypothetical protein
MYFENGNNKWNDYVTDNVPDIKKAKLKLEWYTSAASINSFFFQLHVFSMVFTQEQPTPPECTSMIAQPSPSPTRLIFVMIAGVPLIDNEFCNRKKLHSCMYFLH